MTIRLFDVQNGKVIPTEHCYSIQSLAVLMKEYAEDEEYLKIYAYLFYMTCPNPELNPFWDIPQEDKEGIIYREVGGNFSLEDELIVGAKILCEQLYETSTFRAYKGIKMMLDRLAKYMATAPITDGRDGNITALVNTAAKFDQVRQSYKGVYKDLMEEQKSTVRGGQRLAYDS